ncbi:MAG: acetamidase/formamidase family protein [Coriobacteriales bacterium]|jgi:amidase|nr:acetamidase/formamidase family protein [Coriobacteriales bacterium]
MTTLTDETVFYAFEPGLSPVARVALGEPITLITKDCFANQLKTNEDTLDALDWDYINPATGPVYIEGVKPGDLVRVHIVELTPLGNAAMTTIPGDGAISGIIEGSTTILPNGIDAAGAKTLEVPTERGTLTLPAKPMIGVIGLAPAEGRIPNGTPGAHGGNMDCTLIGEGSYLYLRAAVAGGLFGCGDVHALMGDGEVLVCGAETPARVTVSFSVVDAPAVPTPLLENDELFAVIASASTADEALHLATDLTHDFLTKVAGLSANDAGRLMSLVGNLRFCQVVDPQLTVRFEFPKAVVASLGFEGITQTA